MAKPNKTNNEAKAPKQPKDFSKAVVVVKVIALFTMGLAALFMVGMLEVGQLFVQVLGYGLMVVTLYFALSVVK
jgi:hypothetical protein